MAELRTAAHFLEWDVEAFKEQIPADQFTEWCDFFSLEPHGWEAINMSTARIAWVVAQSNSKRRLKEADYRFKIGGNVVGHAVEQAKWEAMCIRSEVADRIAAGDLTE